MSSSRHLISTSTFGNIQGRLSHPPILSLSTPFSRSLIVPSACFEIIGFQPRHLHKCTTGMRTRLCIHVRSPIHTGYRAPGAGVLDTEYGVRRRTPRQGNIRNRHASCSTDKPDDDDNAGPPLLFIPQILPWHRRHLVHAACHEPLERKVCRLRLSMKRNRNDPPTITARVV